MSEVDALLLQDEDSAPDPVALDVLRRGLRRTPAIWRPIAFSAVISVLTAVGRLAIPVLVQQVIDRGLLGDEGYQPDLVLAFSGAAVAIVAIVAVLSPVAETAMVHGAQDSLYELRRQAFAHIHELSLAQQDRHRRGVLLARVTSDIETIARFVEWGALTWATNLFVIIGAFVVMAVYSWQLALIALATMAVVVPLIRFLQVGQLRAYSHQRTTVGRVLTVFNEVLSGSDAIRSYGYEAQARRRMREAVADRYRADQRTARYTAVLFTVGDLVAGLTLVVVALCAVEWGPGWGLGAGSVLSFFFLVALVQAPIGEITEVLDQTQTAVAGWHKVLTLLEEEPDVVEPLHPLPLPSGALAVEVRDLVAGYDGDPVLRGLDVTIPAGRRVAVVGETGSGKTTFARVLCRLMDPMEGAVRLGGVDIRELSADDRHRAVRLVPQDGFLFDASIGDNIGFGRPDAGPADVNRALDDLGLLSWVRRFADGLDTNVGPRGERLSVGERQVVALARAQVASPGLLVLDEATSSVDPETELALALALERAARGRTVVSIAHRISTAEQADVVMVFDKGRVVEMGSHVDLVGAGGRYQALHESWRRATSR